MLEQQVALSARVSSEQQASAHTIARQIAALRERIAAEGDRLPADHEFLDDGYSGATLVRPGRERLRDLVASGGVDRLYVHSPDRLARTYADQVLLIDEFQRSGVEVVCLNRELGRTPEDDLLLQVQGLVAEYERAKILERSRRGKRHAARTGSVNERSATLEAHASDLASQLAQQSELRLVIGHLEDCAAVVQDNLDHLDWATQRAIIRALVKRVEIDQRQVTVVFRIGPGPIRPSGSDSSVLPDCRRREFPAARQCGPPRAGSALGGPLPSSRPVDPVRR